MQYTKTTIEPVPDVGRRVADILVLQLQQIGVEFVFGISGGAIEPLFDALARQTDGNKFEQEYSNHILRRRTPRRRKFIRTIISRHESGAAFMAEGYARETGRFAVCCATTGPGTTNLVTGVASAYSDRIPMLVITAQTTLPNFGKRGFQESSGDAVNTVEILQHCTKYSSLVSHPDQLLQKLTTALASACQHPRGPVHLSIPLDIMRATTTSSKDMVSIAPLLRSPRVMDNQAVEALWQCVRSRDKMVLYLGGDVDKPMASVIRFAEQTATPIITTPRGKRWINAYHPLNHGVFGFAGHDSARAVLKDPAVKYILAVGASLGEVGTSGWNTEMLLNHKLIHIDPNRENFLRSPMACLHVYGDIEMVFGEMLGRLQDISTAEDSNPLIIENIQDNELPPNIQMLAAETCFSNTVPLKPQRVMQFISARFPAETRIVCDAGNSWAWATHYLHLRSVGYYHIGTGFASMTWGIAAAVGIALAHREAPTICLTGDGSYLMSGQELTVAIQQHLPVIFIVLNDQALGMVKHGQRLGGGEPIGFDLPPINFAAMAEAMGARGYVIRGQDDLEDLDVLALCQHDGPTLLDVHIDPEEVPPMGERMGVLKNA